MAKKYKYLALEARRKLARLYRRGDTVASIAEELGVSPGAVYKDLHRGDTGETDKNWRNEYDPVLADRVFRRIMSERGAKTPAAELPIPAPQGGIADGRACFFNHAVYAGASGDHLASQHSNRVEIGKAFVLTRDVALKNVPFEDDEADPRTTTISAGAGLNRR